MTENTNEKVFAAALAGLLHDVGKVAQRASDNPTRLPQGYEGSKQPVHVAFGECFIKQYVPEKYQKYALLTRPSANPAEDNSLSTLVALADKLAAGEPSDKVEKQLPMQLVSIFDRIAVDRERKENNSHYLPLKPLTLSEDVILRRELLSPEEQRKGYQNLLSLLQERAHTDPGSLGTYLENLLEGFRQYTWCIPSANYHNLPDISLYDHARLMAALAACLTDFGHEEIQATLDAITRQFHRQSQDGDEKWLNKEITLLVGGDISGVQDFIYTISSKSAAKMLRGRSFYLQLLTEAVLRFTLSELNLPYTNVIYSGGGHFFLLAPVSAKQKIEEVRLKITRKLLRHHGTSLYLAIGYTSVPAKGFQTGHFPAFWDQMHKNLGIAKQHRYQELGNDIHEIFVPEEHGGNPETSCSVCGEDTRKVSSMEDDEEGAMICSLCQSFAKHIGKSLPKSKFIALGFGKPHDHESRTAADILASFGMTFKFPNNDSEPIDLPNAAYSTIWALDDPEKNSYPIVAAIPNIHALRYTVNLVTPGTFDDLQEKIKGGFKRLGVLRMDVDNMGNLFKKGFHGDPDKSNDISSLGRLSTLSFRLSLFFEGWIKNLCQEYKDQVYAVYAGGDDLFLIAPWVITPNLAMKIKDAFHVYTEENPDTHLSGGMAFIGGKYPVYQAADDAGEAEELAKRVNGKDAFAFLGKAWKWDDFSKIKEKKDRLVKLVSKENQGGLKGPQSIIRKLRQLAALEEEAAKTHERPLWGPWMWLSAYYFTRMAKNSNEPLKEELYKLRDELMVMDEKNRLETAQWGAAARWAELETRESNS